MKFPIGIQSFENIISDGYVYVDKTAFVYSLTHEGKVYFLSRPRRFGKSLLISTLENYYLGKKELFKGLAIEKLETEWKTYPVFRIDFSTGVFSKAHVLEDSINMNLSKWEAEYGLEKCSDDFGLRLKNILTAAHAKTGMRCVVLVDEYDKPMLDVLDSNLFTEREGERVALDEYNREILKSLYSAFKGADTDLQFVFLTGVTKFSQISVFSGFNQPEDISMGVQYDTLCGITEEEIDKYFAERIALIAESEGTTKEEIRNILRKRFDGYHFSRRIKGVYNPFSLLNIFKKCEIADYWAQSGTPEYLVRLLAHFNESIDDITGKYYDRSQFIDYRADNERPLPMIYQSGYLTIKDYDRESEGYLLDFPNDEVRRSFLTLLANNYLKSDEQIESWLIRSTNNLKRGELDLFRTNLTAFLASVPYTVRRSKSTPDTERYFHTVFYLILRLASTYVVYTEKCQSKGRVDCVIETKNFIYIFEFKLDGTARQALDQIESQGYAREYAADPRKLFKIGCSFSSETGTVGDFAIDN